MKSHKTTSIRVLFVNLECNVAGAERSLLLLVKYIVKDTSVLVASPCSGVLAEEVQRLGAESFGIRQPPRRFNWFGVWMLYFLRVNVQMVSIIWKTRPALIHANSAKAVLAVAIAAFLTRRKVVWHARDLVLSKSVVYICSRLCCRIIAVSETVKKSLVSRGAPQEKICVVHNGVEAKSTLNFNKARCNAGVPTFANIGQFVPWKRQDLFIDAAVAFLKSGSQANFIIVGDDIFGRDNEYKKYLLRKVKMSPFNKNFIFKGWQKDIESLWTQIDCLVHTADAEPFGRVIIEAMAQDIPVIAANSCGPAEIINDGVTGLLFKAGDVSDMTRAMQRIVSDTEFARELGQAGYHCVLSDFTAVKTANKIKEIYRGILVA